MKILKYLQGVGIISYTFHTVIDGQSIAKTKISRCDSLKYITFNQIFLAVNLNENPAQNQFPSLAVLS